MADPFEQFPLPKIETIPLNPAFQNFILALSQAHFPGRDLQQAQNQLSQVLAIFRDGFIVPISALDISGRPIAKNYALPTNIGTINYANQLSVVASITPNPGPAASTWFKQGGTHYCTGG